MDKIAAFRVVKIHLLFKKNQCVCKNVLFGIHYGLEESFENDSCNAGTVNGVRYRHQRFGHMVTSIRH